RGPRHAGGKNSHHQLWQGAPRRDLQRHLLLVAKPPRGYGADGRPILTKISASGPPPSPMCPGRTQDPLFLVPIRHRRLPCEPPVFLASRPAAGAGPEWPEAEGDSPAVRTVIHH